MGDCDWIVVTALYQPKKTILKPPETRTPECWLAFVDRSEHILLNWTTVPLVMFQTYERNENFVKVMLPAVFEKKVIFLNHVLPEARCLNVTHITRAKELTRLMSSRVHLFASKIPSWSGRSIPMHQFKLTYEFAEQRHRELDLADLRALQNRMDASGFNLSTSSEIKVTDTLWMIWPTPDNVAQRFSRLWSHEVARYSSFEKVSYAWVLSRVPEFKIALVDAIYIYSPSQRCVYGSRDKMRTHREAKHRARWRLRHAL